MVDVNDYLKDHPELLQRSTETNIANYLPRPQTNEQLANLVFNLFGISIPAAQVCPHHTPPFKAFADAFFARNSMSVWIGSRGFAGKSYLLALLGLTEAAVLGASVNILGGSGEQSRNVHKYMNDFWAAPNAPKELLASDPSMQKTRLSFGNEIKALMASQTSVRGGHPSRLRLDEVDEMKLSIFEASLGQTMARPGVAAQTVMSSTHHNPDGTMTEILRRAKEKGWGVYSWCLDGNSVIMGINGNYKMKDIRKGNAVYAYKDGQLIKTIVTDHWENGTATTVVIGTSQGKLICTSDHRIRTSGGWVEAGKLRPGMLVQSVWATQSSDKSEDGENFKTWPLSSLPEQQALSGMWQKNRRKVDSVQNVPFSSEDSAWISCEEINQLNMPRLWGGKAKEVTAMSGLSQQTTLFLECAECWEISLCKTANCFIRKCKKAAEQIRGSMRRAFEGIANCFSSRTTVRTFCGRFFAQKAFSSHRSKWAILAFKGRPEEERPEKEAICRKDRIFTVDSLGRPNPSMGFIPVQSITEGPTIPVYDLTVAEGESFVANGLVVHNCYRETSAPHGWLLPEEIERKRGEVTANMWETEYDLQEPSFEGRAIATEHVDKMFQKELGEYQGHVEEYVEIEPPQPGAMYVHGADWAKKQDWTIIVTLRVDVEPFRVVAFERSGRKPWPLMVKKLDKRIARYGGSTCHDATGIGDVVGDYLEHDAVPFLMIGRARTELLNDYIAAVEHDKLVSPYIEYMHGEHKYATVDDLYGAGHLPDSMSAMACAYRQGVLVQSGLMSGIEPGAVFDDSIKALRIGG